MTIKMFIFPCFRAVCVDVYENTGILNQMVLWMVKVESHNRHTSLNVTIIIYSYAYTSNINIKYAFILKLVRHHYICVETSIQTV